MTKLTLADIANLQNETTAVNAINANSDLIETALDNTLSRDGSTPNQMTSSLDMNSNRILNLPTPINGSEPVTLDILDGVMLGPLTININGREKLAGTRTYYVSTTGNDSNSGLSSLLPFATINRAIAVATLTLDWQGNDVFIQLADGTYTENVNLLGYIGRGTQGHTTPTIQGNASNHSAVILNGNITGVENGGYEWCLKNFKINGSVTADYGSWICIDGMVFGTSATSHMNSEGGILEVVSNYTISGNAIVHVVLSARGNLLFTGGQTVTLTGTPVFSSCFINMNTGGYATIPGTITFTGAATGSKFNLQNPYVLALGVGVTPETLFPGSTAGTYGPLTISGDIAFNNENNLSLITGANILAVRNTDAGSSVGPVLVLDRDSSSPAPSDVLGELTFQGRDSAINSQNYGVMTCIIEDATSTSEDGYIQVSATRNGAQSDELLIGGGIGVGVNATRNGPGTITALDSIQSNSATAMPVGGTTGKGLKLSTTSNFGIFFGSGVPTLTAAKGSLYLRSDGSTTSTRAYINTDGSTTWTALTTAA